MALENKIAIFNNKSELLKPKLKKLIDYKRQGGLKNVANIIFKNIKSFLKRKRFLILLLKQI